MTKEDFMSLLDSSKSRIIDKYGIYLYFLIANIVNIANLEKVLESFGYTTKRITDVPDKLSVYSEFYYKDKLIGIIEGGSGIPSVEFYKRNKQRAKEVSKNDLFINPIEGVHGILGWHEVEGKLHILAGGEIILHAIPDSLSEEKCNDFFKNFTQEAIDKFKEREKEKFDIENFKNSLQ